MDQFAKKVGFSLFSFYLMPKDLSKRMHAITNEKSRLETENKMMEDRLAALKITLDKQREARSHSGLVLTSRRC
jgi:hypothetical protein